MEIKELTEQEFHDFVRHYSHHNLYQSVEYAQVMKYEDYQILFFGLVDKNQILGASMIYIEQLQGFKYAYAPRGFLLDYQDEMLLKIFTKLVKKFLGKKEIIAVKLNPCIVKSTFDFHQNKLVENPSYELILTKLKKLGYYHLGYNSYFESMKPRFEANLDLHLPYYELFQNIKKEFKTKIRSAEANGIRIYKGKKEELHYLHQHTQNKYPRNLEYYIHAYDIFQNHCEFFYAKLDTEFYLKKIKTIYEQQEQIVLKLNEQIIKKAKEPNTNLLNKKIKEDHLLNEYRNNLVEATNLLRNYPDGLVLASIIMVTHFDEVYIFMDGYHTNYKRFNAKHLLLWKMIERYSKANFKKLHLGGISNYHIKENNPYQGLNQFKFNFNAIGTEYMGDLELITNSTRYFMYRNSAPIRTMMKK